MPGAPVLQTTTYRLRLNTYYLTPTACHFFKF